MIKQTQTKMFDFSDVGLDFCAGSKTKFPEVFKKMLVTGFNPQTVASVSSTATQVTLTYGVNHGYVADRVLQVTATGGYSKQVYIDSVTATTVTFTENAPTGLSGTISTKVASLGWELVYEVNNIHIYRFKNLDESDIYLRLCFQPTGSANQNYAHPCVGKTADLVAGTINDANAVNSTKSITTPDGSASVLKWQFSGLTGTGLDSSTYNQGYPNHGKGCVVGSNYHFAVLTNSNSSEGSGKISAVIPVASLEYNVLKLPLLIGIGQLSTTTTADNTACFLGNYRVLISGIYKTGYGATTTSFLPSSIDSFNTTPASPIVLQDYTTFQFLGMSAGGIYYCNYDFTNVPSRKITDSPLIQTDVDFTSNIITHSFSQGAGATGAAYYALPIEEIKIGS